VEAKGICGASSCLRGISPSRVFETAASQKGAGRNPRRADFGGRCQMSFMDTLKDKFAMAKNKATEYTQQHGDKVDSGVDKAAQTADKKTGGKYSDKISGGADKAKDTAHKMGDKGEGQS
jgi:hypothetical protein